MINNLYHIPKLSEIFQACQSQSHPPTNIISGKISAFSLINYKKEHDLE